MVNNEPVMYRYMYRYTSLNDLDTFW